MLSRTSTSRWQRSWSCSFTIALAASYCVSAIDLTVTDENSIKKAASQMAFDMMSTYTGNRSGDVPGNLPAPYFWWECGGMFGAMIEYWFYTNDTSYIDVTTQALLHQVGPQNNYMPPNQTSTLGNDDQGFWGMAVMSAAEYNFPNPPSDQPQWLALAQGVYNSQVPRWDKNTCGGGLRWQIFPFNTGFDYKNSISNGANFNLAARLARFTNNQSYADWAEQQFDWMMGVKLIDPQSMTIYDGGHIEDNCSTVTNLQWTYNAGIFLHGAANMYNYTNGSSKWQQRVEGLLKATSTFFPQGNIMAEVACEGNKKCNTDELSFKAYLSRWLAATSVLAPFTAATIQPLLASSAQAAAKQCTGGSSGTLCGTVWNGGAWDGTQGVGQQMSALEVTQTNLAFIPQNGTSSSGGSSSQGGNGAGSATPGGGNGKGPLTQSTGGTSQGDASAGTTPQTWSGKSPPAPITAGDRAGASFLTLFFISVICGGSVWINYGA